MRDYVETKPRLEDHQNKIKKNKYKKKKISHNCTENFLGYKQMGKKKKRATWSNHQKNNIAVPMSQSRCLHCA